VTAFGFAAAGFADTAALVRGHDDGQAEGSETGHLLPFAADMAAGLGLVTAAADAPFAEHEPKVQPGPHAG
jgi:hypothetical protein